MFVHLDMVSILQDLLFWHLAVSTHLHMEHKLTVLRFDSGRLKVSDEMWLAKFKPIFPLQRNCHPAIFFASELKFIQACRRAFITEILKAAALSKSGDFLGVILEASRNYARPPVMKINWCTTQGEFWRAKRWIITLRSGPNCLKCKSIDGTTPFDT